MTVPVSLKQAVIDRDGGFCLLVLECCTGEAQTTDHRANRGMGGAGDRLDDPVNLVAACTLCNGAKADGRQRDSLTRRGLLVLPSSTHEKTLARVRSTPVEYPKGQSFLLLSNRDDRGRWILGRLPAGEIAKEVSHAS